MSRFWDMGVNQSRPARIESMTTLDHQHQLLTLLARLSFRLGTFTLASGATSDYYIDCRTTTLHAEGGRLTGHAILELLESHNIQAEAVGGLTMGADPIVSNVATARAIEGFLQPGAHVIIVDDVCTTGGSTITAIEAAREAGMVIAAVVCIVERQEANGRPAVEAAAAGAPFLALFTANDVRTEHLKQAASTQPSLPK